jgi:secondary thiamine-phosphate synthase enzyme
MIIKLERIKLQTRKSEEAIDITAGVEEIVRKSGVKNGLVNILTSHTSSGLLVTEGIPCLEEDILAHFSRLFPEDENYHHRRYLDFDGRLGFNADAHLKSVLGGISCTFPIENGKLVKGSRQTIYFM